MKPTVKYFLILLLLLSLGIPFNALAVSKVEISDGSVKALYHWEDGTDSSGNGGNTTNNSVTFVAGQLNNAASFNGTASVATTSDSVSNSITGNMTISLWVKFNSTSTDPIIVNKFNSTGSQQSFYFQYTVGGFRFLISSTGGNQGFGDIPFVITAGTWYYVVATYTASTHTYQLYVNNVSKGTADVTLTSIFDSNSSLDFGRYNGSSNFLNGLLDDTSLSNVVMSTTTINSLWNGGTGAEICTTVGCANAASTAPQMQIVWWE